MKWLQFKETIIFSLGWLLLISFGWAIVYAAMSYRSDPSSTITINEQGIFKKVTNDGSLGRSYFIPTNSLTEWNNFINADSYLTDITLSSCQSGSRATWPGTCTNFCLSQGCNNSSVYGGSGNNLTGCSSPGCTLSTGGGNYGPYSGNFSDCATVSSGFVPKCAWSCTCN